MLKTLTIAVALAAGLATATAGPLDTRPMSKAPSLITKIIGGSCNNPAGSKSQCLAICERQTHHPVRFCKEDHCPQCKNP
jgi:hypothetical protein